MLHLSRLSLAKLICPALVLSIVGCSEPELPSQDFLSVSGACDEVCIQQRRTIIEASKSRIVQGTAAGVVGGAILGAMLSADSPDAMREAVIIGGLFGGLVGNMLSSDVERRRLEQSIVEGQRDIDLSKRAFRSLLQKRKAQIAADPQNETLYIEAYRQDIAVARVSLSRFQQTSSAVEKIAQASLDAHSRKDQSTVSRAELLRFQRFALNFGLSVSEFSKAVDTENRSFLETYVGCDTSESSQEDTDRFTSFPGPSCAPTQN